MVSRMQAQPLLLERPVGAQVVLAIVVPAVFGLVCGLLLSVSAVLYTVLTLVAILGGIFAGYDHLGADQGVVRGFCGGLLFGVFILVGHSLGGTAKASIPSPHVILPIATTIL